MTMSDGPVQLIEDVQSRYGVDAQDVRLVRSPYRICPLGAHIDHQLGTVTAMAIDRAVWLAFAQAPAGPDDARVRLSSRSFPGEVDFALNDVPDRSDGDWGNFPRGAVRAMQAAGYDLPRGIVGVTDGSLAEGGLSSSAAIGVAYLLALQAANGLDISPQQNIRLDQAIENGYLGLRNGILDQSAVLLSRRAHLTVIDCRSLTHEVVPAGANMPAFRVLIAFSGLRQALVSTDYNRRVSECQEAATALLAAAGRPGTEPVLGHITQGEYEAHALVLTGAPSRRAAHVFGEMKRVRAGVDAWHRGDAEKLGRLMTASGHSSIHNYECGAPPLIDLYEILTTTDGVYGARFSGAGFRGCCVALVAISAAEEAAETVRRRYAEVRPELAADAPVFLCDSDDGACLLAQR